MSQEPWNEEVYQTETVSRKERLNKGVVQQYLQSWQLFSLLSY